MIGVTEDDREYMQDTGYRLLGSYESQEAFESADPMLDSDREHLVATVNDDGFQVWESPRQKKTGADTPVNTKR